MQKKILNTDTITANGMSLMLSPLYSDLTSIFIHVAYFKFVPSWGRSWGHVLTLGTLLGTSFNENSSTTNEE
eukprot:scaffold35245_cov36-Cyclotella_meneghiniana.AAC.1